MRKMNNVKFFRYFLLVSALLCGLNPIAKGCTSALIGAERGADGRWILWKHRDTGYNINFIKNFEATDSTLAYVALFNEKDKEGKEAWIGFNEAGFAVMNTATYNIPSPKKGWEDREGLVMTDALRHCRSLKDFYEMLLEMPKPRGVQANFGAFDAEGKGAYFEVDDYGCIVYLLDSQSAATLDATMPKPATDEIRRAGYLTRTNFSMSGNIKDRKGVSRYLSENHLLDSIAATNRPWASEGKLGAEDLIESLSRSFYLPEKSCNLLDGKADYPDNGDVISRRSSTASVAIEGPLPGEDPAKTMIMWVTVGVPAVAVVEAVALDSIPYNCRLGSNGEPNCKSALTQIHDKSFYSKNIKGKGKYFFNMDYLRKTIPQKREESLQVYPKERQRVRK